MHIFQLASTLLLVAPVLSVPVSKNAAQLERAADTIDAFAASIEARQQQSQIKAAGDHVFQARDNLQGRLNSIDSELNSIEASLSGGSASTLRDLHQRMNAEWGNSMRPAMSAVANNLRQLEASGGR